MAKISLSKVKQQTLTIKRKKEKESKNNSKLATLNFINEEYTDNFAEHNCKPLDFRGINNYDSSTCACVCVYDINST